MLRQTTRAYTNIAEEKIEEDQTGSDKLQDTIGMDLFICGFNTFYL